MNIYEFVEFSNVYEANEYVNNFAKNAIIKAVIQSKDGFIVLFEFNKKEEK
jgi:hypothetical protein